jgi:hypothetical protein
VRLADERRTVASFPTDRDVLESFERAEGVGRAGRVEQRDDRNVFDPR